MDADLDTLAIALYVKIDDELKTHLELVRWRPQVGFWPVLSDAELATLAVLQEILGFTSDPRRAFMPVRSTSAFNTSAARSTGCQPDSWPFRFPVGVRTASTTAFLIRLLYRTSGIGIGSGAVTDRLRGPR